MVSGRAACSSRYLRRERRGEERKVRRGEEGKEGRVSAREVTEEDRE